MFEERLRGYKLALLDHRFKFDEEILIVDGLKEEDTKRSADSYFADEDFSRSYFYYPWFFRRLQ